jgi:hypothetical protein
MTYRIQFDVSDDEWEDMKRLMTLCGLDTRKDLFTNAYALLEWAVEERLNGKQIASLDVDKNTLTQVAMPLLRRLGGRNNLSTIHNPDKKGL